ncbi:hypothetical protein BRADI_2g19695v3, partial [Brachypodium distachyon]
YTWSVVAMTLGVNNSPSCFSQYFHWIARHTKLSRNMQLVGIAAICWATWKIRNRACFEKRLIRSPAELICSACSFMKYWAGLQRGGEDDVKGRGAPSTGRSSEASPCSSGDGRASDQGRSGAGGLCNINGRFSWQMGPVR